MLQWEHLRSVERKRARPNKDSNSPVIQNEVTDDSNHNGI